MLKFNDPNSQLLVIRAELFAFRFFNDSILVAFFSGRRAERRRVIVRSLSNLSEANNKISFDVSAPAFETGFDVWTLTCDAEVFWLHSKYREGEGDLSWSR